MKPDPVVVQVIQSHKHILYPFKETQTPTVLFHTKPFQFGLDCFVCLSEILDDEADSSSLLLLLDI